MDQAPLLFGLALAIEHNGENSESREKANQDKNSPTNAVVGRTAEKVDGIDGTLFHIFGFCCVNC